MSGAYTIQSVHPFVTLRNGCVAAIAALAALAATAAVRDSVVWSLTLLDSFFEVLAAGPISLGWTTLFLGPPCNLVKKRLEIDQTHEFFYKSWPKSLFKYSSILIKSFEQCFKLHGSLGNLLIELLSPMLYLCFARLYFLNAL